jgi:hypothetical protein
MLMSEKLIGMQFRKLRLPDANDYAMTTVRGKHRYRDAWGQLEADANKLVHEIVRFRAVNKRSAFGSLLGKLQKHAEKCEVLGGERYAAWVEAEELASGERKGGWLGLIWELITDDDSQEREEKVRRKELSANSKRQAKVYDALVLERERLMTEIEAVGLGGGE